jgi:uncharacterized membrane protein
VDADPAAMTSRQDAQRRVDRIQAFREELSDLEREQVLHLSTDDRARVFAHQAALIAALSREFDVDVAAAQRQLSIGMRLASAFGALALGVSVFLFFYHFWVDLTTSVQVAILLVAPLVGIVGMAIAAERERTLYVTGVLGVITVAAFVLDLYALGQIFNLVPSPNAFLAWAAFAMVLAYTFRLRWLLAIGLAALTMWVSATIVVWSGGLWWWSVFDRFETFLLPGVAILLVGGRLQHEEFAPTWRLVGWFVVFFSLLVLSVGDESLLPWSRDTVQFFYQVGGMAVTAGAIAAGVRRQWGETVNLGALFFAAFLITRLTDWWWNWMPSYLFFLIIGLLALGLIVVFRQIRNRMEARL